MQHPLHLCHTQTSIGHSTSILAATVHVMSVGSHQLHLSVLCQFALCMCQTVCCDRLVKAVLSMDCICCRAHRAMVHNRPVAVKVGM